MALDWKKEYHRYFRYFVDVKSLYRQRKVIVYTGITLTLVAISFFSLFAIKPTVTTIVSLTKEIEEKKSIEQKLQVKINSLSAAQSNYASLTNLLEVIDEALPTEPLLTDVAYYFEYLTQKNNLTVRSINYDPIRIIGAPQINKKNPTTETLNSLNFSLSGTGKYEDIVNLFKDLDNTRRVILIESLTFNGGQIEETPTLNFTATGKIFYLPKTNQK